MDQLRRLSHVAVHDLPKERIVLGAKDDFSHFFTEVGKVRQVDSVVVDAQELVDHGLVGPLVQQRSDWVFSPIQDQEGARA
jgi:hypothetical protein